MGNVGLFVLLGELWGFLAVSFETKQYKYNKCRQPVEPPDFRLDGISVRLSPRLELLKRSGSWLLFFFAFVSCFFFFELVDFSEQTNARNSLLVM